MDFPQVSTSALIKTDMNMDTSSMYTETDALDLINFMFIWCGLRTYSYIAEREGGKERIIIIVILSHPDSTVDDTSFWNYRRQNTIFDINAYGFKILLSIC